MYLVSRHISIDLTFFFEMNLIAISLLSHFTKWSNLGGIMAGKISSVPFIVFSFLPLDELSSRWICFSGTKPFVTRSALTPDLGLEGQRGWFFSSGLSGGGKHNVFETLFVDWTFQGLWYLKYICVLSLCNFFSNGADVTFNYKCIEIKLKNLPIQTWREKFLLLVKHKNTVDQEKNI